MPIHPIQTARRLREAYIRYLKTIKPFQDDRLREEFSRALEAENMLVKGPYLELTLPFKPGKTIRELMEEQVLSARFAAFCHEEGGLRPDRPLYWHQEQAIRKAREGRNLVITTGTGSGKTEAFLIPILDSLAREAEAGTLEQSGVRALLLYPMNALANDQMERLRGYLKKFPQITFGRYVGETKKEYDKALEFYKQINQGKEPPPNELISREQMQAHPPHILLTNYAMLEYLLLRPADTDLFDGEKGKHWRFLVLDEAHAYDGAQATEIAMLLRRLQDRVTGGGQKKLQAFAVSATLGEDTPQVRAQISEFAHKIFNLDFNPEDVIFGQREPQSGLSAPWGRGAPELYARLAALADDYRQNPNVALPDTLPGVAPELMASALHNAQGAEEPLPRFLYELLRGDERIHLLRNLLQQNPLLLDAAARRVFPELPESESLPALADLISAAILARERKDKLPLLPARYHLFARALEGAFVCLNESHPAHRQEGKPRLFLTRQKFCEHCGSRVFELANCTRCGTSYLIGDEREGYELPESEFSPANPRDDDRTYLIQNSVIYDNELEARRLRYFVLKPLEASEADEDALVEGEMEAGEEPDEKTEEVQLCPRCGAIFERGDPGCGCGVPLRAVARVEMGKKKTLERCVSCSTYTQGGVIFRFLTGQDAPVSVLAGTLYRDVPEAKKGTAEREHPGGGRKLLVFTDNRQRAAFFAPYLQRAQERQLRRRLMVESLKNLSDEEPLRFSDWMGILLTYTKKANIFPEDVSLRKKRLTVATWLMLEFSGLDKRLGLEGVGLLYFRPFRSARWQPPQELLAAPWNCSPEEAYQVLAILLNTLRRQGAVTFLLEDEDIHLLDDEEKRNEFRPRARNFYVRETGADNYFKFGVYSWLPSERYNNSRRDYLARLLAKKKGEKTPSAETIRQAGQLLSALWKYLLSDTGGNWFEGETKERVGTVYRLRHDRWEVIPTLDDLSPWWVCDTCQNLSAFSVDGVCPTYGCGGTLQPLAQHEHVIRDNLYRYQYQNEAPLVLKAMEHTAQWTSTKAAEIQKQFIVGEVNVLSCSTTFELGVDVGDLNAVLLRNVPPSAANYIQRAGRAGRRSDSVAMVVTFAQRRQHDLTFYAEPERMIAGKIRPPLVPLKNDKIIRRHLHSVAFAAFLRWVKNRGWEYDKTGDFFAPEDPARNGVNLFKAYLSTRPPELQAALKRITPTDDPELPQRLGLEDWGWLAYLIDPEDGVFENAARTLIGELDEFLRLEQEEKNKKRSNGRLIEEYQKVQDTIRGRDLLGYLGSKNVLPKYGFPTDVVPLQTDHLHIPDADKIELDRDLKQAISEFAPGGQVVAAGKIWYSRGIKRLPGRAPVPYSYAICKDCKRINIRPGTDPITHCICGKPLQGSKRGTYIVPEYGFIAEAKTDVPGENPPERIYASRVYLANYITSSANQPAFDPRRVEPDPEFTAGVQVLKGYTRNAYLGLVNNGYGLGFHVCSVCGWADVIEYMNGKPVKPPREHINPLTQEKCTGSMSPYHLGHHFMTDVLQLRFSMSISGESKIYSLLYAILNGASDALEIPRNDVDGLIFYQDGQPSFLLYDTTPGGSGHVEMIHNHLRPALEAAYKRVSECEGCAQETSCYSCLRDYNNQFAHDKLVRGEAALILSRVLGK
ncbi:MAG: DEAD/DEAH box helicase [Anaerolineales bacterium]